LSNLLREFLGRQSSGSVDLDHAVPAPSKWPFPLLRQRLQEAEYNRPLSIIGRALSASSVAAVDDLANDLSHCCVNDITRSSDSGLSSASRRAGMHAPANIPALRDGSTPSGPVAVRGWL
jgi:hypothetical protein